ncbi:NAD(P)/FAD-dependent oxidoreductase [Angustibacter sp. McL0619]|uniref:NAD(P)/FAD-dependent oxidoreductase n=1 Tax=Angustibacter sp. McL0619 TaxID=3415676 RepID=UPI003CF2AFF7
MPEQQPIVVVGGGLAGGKTVEQLREKGYAGPLVLFSTEPHLPYERPPLSKGYLMGESERDEVFVHDAVWYDEHDVELALSEQVASVDLAAHQVRTTSGRVQGYSNLVLATGSEPRRLNLTDLDAAHVARVLTLRTLDESESLREWLRPGVRLVVVGGGWIGLEVASAARKAGAEVTVLELDPLPLQRVLGAQVAEAFAAKHRREGVDLRTEVTVAGVVADGEGLRVDLDGGDAVGADVVLVGIGISPRTELAEAAGLDVDNGVVVDGRLRTSDPDVFAVGDVANAPYPRLGRRLRVEHWAAALNQPEVVAGVIAGGDATWDLLPYFFTDQYDWGMEYHGFADPRSQRVVVRGDLAGGEFVAAWLDDEGAVTAAMHVNQWDDGDAVKELVGTTLDAERFTDTGTPLG